MKKASGPDATDVIIAQGSYSYTAPDGTVINLNYIADDENGFKPEVGLNKVRGNGPDSAEVIIA